MVLKKAIYTIHRLYNVTDCVVLVLLVIWAAALVITPLVWVTDQYFLLLNKISLYLTAYYFHDDKKGRLLGTELLAIDEISKKMAGTLLVKIIVMYADCLTKRFEPEKDLYERLEVVQKEFYEDLEKQLIDIVKYKEDSTIKCLG